MRRSLVAALLTGGLTFAFAPVLAAPIHPGVTPSHPAVMNPALFYPQHKVRLKSISTDPWTNSDSQHQTEVEPDAFAWGSTIVSVFQQGRYYTGGGASDIGFSTSTDGGKTWTPGYFKGWTQIENSKNPYQRVSDPSVAYDAKHAVWLMAALPINNSTGLFPAVAGSTDGLTWTNPVQVAKTGADFEDKSWIGCDDWSASPYYGNCYVEFDDASAGEQEYMTTSSDGGKTWSKPYLVTNVFGIGGQPIAQPNGNVVVADFTANGTIGAYTSTNGGKTWGNFVNVATVNYNIQGGGLRSRVLPSSAEDGAGNVYVAWPDCSFRSNCSTDDIVYATSSDGKTWSQVTRVPIDPTNSQDDHFFPALAINQATMGASAHIGLTYYYYPNGACVSSNCQLFGAFIGSKDGGATWSHPKNVLGPLSTTWLANTDQGFMVGDYVGISADTSGRYNGIYEDATVPGTLFNEYTVTSRRGLKALGERYDLSSRGDRQISRRPYRNLFRETDTL